LTCLLVKTLHVVFKIVSGQYQRFSKLIQQAIDDFRAKRISDLDYLEKVTDIRNKIVGKIHDDVPESLHGNENAMAYFGVLKPFLVGKGLDQSNLEDIASKTAIAIHGIIESHKKVNLWNDKDAQNLVVNEIDDFLYDEIRTKQNIDLSVDEMDKIIEKTLQVARFRSYNG
jgi:type I restriction enzyme, R subunit